LAPDSTVLWTGDFSAPGQARLVAGTYAPATRFPPTVFTGLLLVTGERTCNELTGRFVVLEAVYAPDGAVQSFAADVEQHCEDADPGLFAAIRYNSAVADISPFGGGYPRYELEFTQPDHGRVEGAGIDCGSGQSSCAGTWNVPQLAILTAIPDPGYIFTGWTGACNGPRLLNVHVNSVKKCDSTFAPVLPTDPRSLLLWHSAAGEYIGGSHNNVYTPANSKWSFQSTVDGNGIDIVITSIADTRESAWTLRFKAPADQVLEARSYGVPNDLYSRRRSAGLDIFGNGRHCVYTEGLFIVREIARQPGTNEISSLAIDFEQRCEQTAAPPLTGRLRYNSTIDTRVPQVALDSNGVVSYNGTVTWRASAVPGGDVEYSFRFYHERNGWATWSGYSPASELSWSPTYGDIGVHSIQVWARLWDSTEDYEAWAGASIAVVDRPHPSVDEIQIAGSQPLPAGQLAIFRARASGGAGSLQYKFLRWDPGGWKVVQDYGVNDSYQWMPGIADIGPHALQVWVRNDASGADYEAWAGVAFDVGVAERLAVRLENSNPGVIKVGYLTSWSAFASGGIHPVQCRFARLDADGWHEVRPYGDCNYAWTPTAADVGEHAVQVWARNAGSGSLYDAWASTSIFRVIVAPFPTPSLFADVVFPVPSNTPVTWTVQLTEAAPAPPLYEFRVWRSGAGWTVLRQYDSLPVIVWTPPENGTYVLEVRVRTARTTTGYETYTNSGYITVASDSPARLVDLAVDVQLPAPTGARITWTATATGGTAGPLEFQFVRLNELTGEWTIVQPYSSSNRFAWNTMPADAGSYVIQAWVRSAGSSAAYEDWRTTGSFRLQ
jgi:hypothetical protein